MGERDAADALDAIVEGTTPALRAFGEIVASAKVRPGAWSIKEVLGHLIDSAANNHQRFVRAQETDALVLPGYEQEAWVRSQDYQSRPWLDLIELWAAYNRHLAHVIRRIPPRALSAPCRIGGSDPVTLGFIVEDYVIHLQHHLRQIEEIEAAQGA